MARIRTIKPDFWKSEKLAERLPGADGRQARLLFIGLWNFSEDHGVIRGKASYIRSELFPYDEDVTTADVERWLGLLEAGGFVVRFIRDGSTYLWIRKFSEHQRIEKPSKPTLPSPSEAERDPYRETPGGLREPSPTPPEKARMEVEGEVEVDTEVEVDQKPLSAAPTGRPVLDLAPTVADPPSPARRVFEHWRKVMNKGPRTEFDDKRKRAVKARLKGGYTAEDLMLAVDGCANTPHNMGSNDRGQRYDDLELICRDAAHVDRFMGNAPAPPKSDERVMRPEIPDTTAGRSWQRVLDVLRADGKIYALGWIEQMTALEQRGRELELGCPDRYFLEWIKDHYAGMLGEVWKRVGGETIAFIDLSARGAA